MAVRSVLITGTSGFVGRRLLERLPKAEFTAIHIGGRTRPVSVDESFTWHPIDLPVQLPPDEVLRGVDTVVHLAASTGKARASEHFLVNEVGTKVLAEQAVRCGVRNLLMMSTIAVGFTDLRRYHYAQAKKRAEEAVAASGLRYTILRPTIVAGRGGGAWEGMLRLSCLPVTPIFGSGLVRVQPIDVDDLADATIAVLRDEHFANETLELGGPDQVAIGDLIRRLRVASGRVGGRIFRLPLGLCRRSVGLVEDVFGPVLPIGAGQLSTFAEDGTARPNDFSRGLVDRMCNLETMIARSTGHNGVSVNVIDRECDVFCRYLTGRPASEYVREKYRAFHRTPAATEYRPGPIDNSLLAVARRHPDGVRLADAYASFARPGGILRRKLVLLLAILESCAPGDLKIDEPSSPPGLRVWLDLAIAVTCGAAVLLLAMAVFAPWHVFSVATRRPEQMGNT